MRLFVYTRVHVDVVCIQSLKESGIIQLSVGLPSSITQEQGTGTLQTVS